MTQKGFEIKLTMLQSQLYYHVGKEGTIEFANVVDLEKGETASHDFGIWTYLEGEGFFRKKAAIFEWLSASGHIVEREKVSDFIDRYTLELEQVPNFFSSQCPIEKLGVRLELTNKGTVTISPFTSRHKERRSLSSRALISSISRPLFLFNAFINSIELVNRSFHSVVMGRDCVM